MRIASVLLAVCCCLSVVSGQWVETTIPLPDSVSGISEVGALLFHSPTNTIYVGGRDSFLVSIDARSNTKLNKFPIGFGSSLLCSNPSGNRVYCLYWGTSISVIDGATNQWVKTIPVVRVVTDLIYVEPENKLYCGNTTDSFLRVIDCAGESVMATVPVSNGPGALCYNPQLNRVYCAHETEDEVSVIDCAADTVVAAIWVRGVEPRDICFESASNCVYTANRYSGTVTAIDCAGDTVLRVVAAGRGPANIMTGPPGKIYCANYRDSSVSVISGSSVKTVRTSGYPVALSYDPANSKVYCANDYSDTVAVDNSGSVTVIDAVQDTVVAQVGAEMNLAALCYNPAGGSTYAASALDDVVAVIGGVSDTVEAVLAFGRCRPGPLCFNPANNHLYCLDDFSRMLFIIDGDSNRLLKTLVTGSGSDALILNAVRNKVYFANSSDSTVSILDCASDSIVATLKTGRRPRALCCSDGGNVYVVNESGGVVVIDGFGDTVRAVLPINDNIRTLCYDPTDNKVYVGGYDAVGVIDADGDSVVATIPVPHVGYAEVCWNRNHDKVYAYGQQCDSVAVIDCTSDTVVKNVVVATWLGLAYSNATCDKVYLADSYGDRLHVIEAATDTSYRSLKLGSVTALLDNGKAGPANRLYCADISMGVTVVEGYKTDSILRRISVGLEPVALAWNPTHSWVYVSNAGSSSITVIRDSLPVGIEENQPSAAGHKPQATVTRGVLFLPRDGIGTRSELPGRNSVMSRAALLDAAGRRVMDLHPGANDVRALAPGVYFVRPAQAQAQAQAIRKVVIAR